MFDEYPRPQGEAVTPDANAEYLAVEKRQVAEWVALVNRWPNFRQHFAYGFLGHAIAIADSFGCDVEGFLAELRKREPKPPVLTPRSS